MLKKSFILQPVQGLWLGQAPHLSRAGIGHAVTSKLHGQSEILPGSLNLSLHVGDKKEAVIQNRKKLCAALELDFARLTCAQQVHGKKAVYVDEKLAGSGKAEFAAAVAGADALYTDRPGLPLLLLFADCTPVIIADPLRKVVAVVHAGWRGTVQQIVKETVAEVSRKLCWQPENCLAFIGPCIAGCCYEVSGEVYAEAAKTLEDADRFFTPGRQQHWHFDLARANKAQLLQAGLKEENILLSGVCTLEEKELFFSHRGDLGKTGRFAALVYLEN